MKLSKTVLLILFVISFAGIQCGGSGGSSPNNSLNGKHTVKGFDEVISQVSPDCGGETSSSSGNPVPSGSALSNAEDKIEIIFSDKTFSVERNGNEILSGTWKDVDDDTLEITAEGQKIKVDYSFDGNELDISLSEGSSMRTCAQGTPLGPAEDIYDDESNGSNVFPIEESSDQFVPAVLPAPDGSGADNSTTQLPGLPNSSGYESGVDNSTTQLPGLPNSVEAAEALISQWATGTWCYESGYTDTANSSVASLIISQNRYYVGLYNQSSVRYEWISDKYIINKDLKRFGLNYYSPSLHVADWTVDGNRLQLYYEPLKTTTLVKVSDAEVSCP